MSYIVLHYTAMASAEAAVSRLCDPASEVSAHYLIAEDGRLFALVAESERAWHAGVARWRGEDDLNSRSIGIELAHPGHLGGRASGIVPPFSEPQMRRLERLLGGLLRRHRLGPDAVLGHQDVAPGRKIDPGESFDWARLDRIGCGIGPQGGLRSNLERGSVESVSFWDELSRIGYGDWPRADLLAAFRQRFRPACVRLGGDAPEPGDVAAARAAAARFEAARRRTGGVAL